MCVNYEPWNSSVASYASALPSTCGTIDFYPSMYLLYLSYVQVLIIPLSTPSNFHFERLKVSASIITLASAIASSMSQPRPFYGLFNNSSPNTADILAKNVMKTQCYFLILGPAHTYYTKSLRQTGVHLLRPSSRKRKIF